MRYNSNNQIIFEVGDWIIFKPALSEEQIKQINNIVMYTVDDTKNYPAGHGQRFYCDDIEVFSTNSMLYSNVRLATQKEIDKAIEAQKPKFKIGDWVTVIEHSRTGYNKTFRIVGFDSTSFIPIIVDIRDTHAGTQYSKEQIRLATAEEIEKTQRIDFKVGDWVYAERGLLDANDNRTSQYIPVFKVDEVVELGNEKNITYIRPERGISGGIKASVCRLATPKEIKLAKKALEIKIGEHIVEFRMRATKVGCLEKDNADWIKLYEAMCTFNLKTVQHEDGTVAKFQEIRRIIHSIK